MIDPATIANPHALTATPLLLIGSGNDLARIVVPVSAVEKEAVGEVRGMTLEHCRVPLPPSARVVQAERTGVPACVAGPAWEFMMTSEFICTSKEIAGGARFSVWTPGSVPRGMRVVFRLRRGIVAYGTK